MFGVRGSGFAVRGSHAGPVPPGLGAVRKLRTCDDVTTRIERGPSKTRARIRAVSQRHDECPGEHHGQRSGPFYEAAGVAGLRRVQKDDIRLCEEPPACERLEASRQLEESVRGLTAHLAEGYGRFSPPGFARFAVMARASLMESQNHRLDLVDRGYISEERRASVNALAETALEQVTGLLEYLQSPEALRNGRRARERRIATRAERRCLDPERRTQNPEPRSPNLEPGTPNPEPGPKPEPGMPKSAPKAEPEPGSEHPEG